MTLRALLLVSSLDGSGPGRVMTTLAQELLDSEFEPILAATHGPTSSDLIDEARSTGVSVENLRMSRLWDPGGILRLVDLIRRVRPALVHTRTTRADIVGRAGAGTKCAVVTNTVNLYPHDCLAQHGPVLGRVAMAVARAGRRATSLFVANAKAVGDNTAAAFRVPPARIRVVYDGIHLDRWRDVAPAFVERTSPSDFVCLTVARLHSQKGLEDLVNAAVEVASVRPDVRFLIAGEGPLRGALESRIRRQGLDEVVLLLGHRTDIPALMALSDLFVLPSRFEGLPSAIIEAMAGARPVVATGVAGVSELVTDGVTGWIVPPGSPQILAQTVLGALGADLETAGKAGREKAERLFSASAMAGGFVQVYHEAIQSRRA